MLTNSLKVLHINKSNFFKLNCFHSNQEIWENCRRSDLNSVRARVLFCLLKGTVKRHFLDIYLSAFFGVRNLGNTLAMGLIFFWKMLKT